jgi:hypothetical protein
MSIRADKLFRWLVRHASSEPRALALWLAASLLILIAYLLDPDAVEDQWGDRLLDDLDLEDESESDEDDE